MRVSKEQVAQNRQALLAAAARLLRNKGLEGAGVAEICHEAGLTHGAFYRHFASKEALMLEACAQAFDWTPLDLPGTRPTGLGTQAIVANYLSVEHRDCTGLGCPVAALAVDAARAGGEIGEAFAEGVEAYLSSFTRAVRSEGADASDAAAQALHTLATMLGGLIIARATAQARPQLSRKVLRTLRERLAAGGIADQP
jgi:TetR/AcrR family transcriptional repressor of nem operon